MGLTAALSTRNCTISVAHALKTIVDSMLLAVFTSYLEHALSLSFFLRGRAHTLFPHRLDDRSAPKL